MKTDRSSQTGEPWALERHGALAPDELTEWMEMPPEPAYDDEEDGEPAAEWEHHAAAGVGPSRRREVAVHDDEQVERERYHAAVRQELGDSPTAWGAYLRRAWEPGMRVGRTTEHGEAVEPCWHEADKPRPTTDDSAWDDRERNRERAEISDHLGVEAGQWSIYFDHSRQGGDRLRDYSAAKVTDAAGDTRYERIKGDRAAIAAWLTQDGRSLEDWRLALRRGRRTQEAEALRAELAAKVAALIAAPMDANQADIAAVLGCGVDAIRGLRAAAF